MPYNVLMPNRALLLLCFLLSSNALSEVLTTPDYQLEYDSSWQISERQNPPGYRLYSLNLKTEVTLSSLRFDAGQDILELSKKWLEARISAELKAMSEINREVSINKSLKPIQIGYQVEYWGDDSEGRRFRYWGVVTEKKLVNVYVESYIQPSDEIETILKIILGNLLL